MSGVDISNYKTSFKPVSKEKKKKNSFLHKEINLFGDGLKDKKKEEFYLELSVLLIAGVDIKTSLELIANEQEKQKDKELFQQIKEVVIKGSTLSGAIQASGKFTAYEYYTIQIGEETGLVSKVLKELAEFYRKRIQQKRQLTSVLSYPIFVIVASVGALTFMLNTVVPMFSGMYTRFGSDLPGITKFIVSLSAFFSSYFYIFLLTISGIAALVATQRKKEWFRKVNSSLILKIPVFGEVMRRIYLARLCHSMTLLLGAKIPLLRCIELIRKMIDFYPLEVSLSKVEKDILHGTPLHKSLSQFPIYYPKMVTLVKIGEEVNQLDDFFDKISKQYNEEVEHQIGIIKALIEPMMMIVLGLIVGTIVIAMYLPLFQMTTLF